jgi:hypothetical protein
MNVECLRDCNADCCRAIERIIFDFSGDEAEMIRQAGGNLYYMEDGYVMTKVCPFLEGNRCELHGDERQPECCQKNVVGEKLCLALRIARQRFKPWEVE